MMMNCRVLLLAIMACFSANAVSASVFMPRSMQVKRSARGAALSSNNGLEGNHELRLALRQRNFQRTSPKTAMAIPGYGIAEQVFVGGFSNFLSIYNLVITGRILLSWFPQAQGVAILQPIFQITDPYLNLFRGLIPPVFGLDLSPILAFFLLNVLTNATAAVGYDETTAELMKSKLRKQQQLKSAFNMRTALDQNGATAFRRRTMKVATGLNL
mmetsp:Transcript_23574/g.65591  ORF Transcript_23574/g.65591 Transcript_23574/m.65591 type:complete len:214 (-) Transcript_23574:211-852(-)